jgi:hypothetical protein
MMPATSAEAYAVIDALTARQLDVLGCIAMNADGGHPQRTLDALVRKGLIEGYPEVLPGRFPVTITRYFVPIHVHIAYCTWASAHINDEDEDAGDTHPHEEAVP